MYFTWLEKKFAKIYNEWLFHFQPFILSIPLSLIFLHKMVNLSNFSCQIFANNGSIFHRMTTILSQKKSAKLMTSWAWHPYKMLRHDSTQTSKLHFTSLQLKKSILVSDASTLLFLTANAFGIPVLNKTSFSFS